jgi:dTDP-L-rhamnose 4-epimerase
MRVLITGGAGFIGSHIADLLTKRGNEVVSLDALLPAAHGEAPESSHTHSVVHGDVRDPRVLDELLPGVDVVCHQAAMVGHGLDPSDAPEFVSHNDFGTAVLLAALHRHGVRRLVLASSMVVYGEGRYECARHGVVPAAPRATRDIDAGLFEPPCPQCGAPLEQGLVSEDAAMDPRSTYAATKVAQEHLAGAWARQTGGGVWALRYHNVYGARMPRDTPYAGVASIFRSALERGEAPQVMEDGKQHRDFVHVTDVASINALAVAADPPPGLCAPLNVCSGEPHTIGELANALADNINGPRPSIVGGARPGDVRHIVADPARAERILGFRAEVGFTAGVAGFATAPLRASVRR